MDQQKISSTIQKHIRIAVMEANPQNTAEMFVIATEFAHAMDSAVFTVNSISAEMKSPGSTFGTDVEKLCSQNISNMVRLCVFPNLAPDPQHMRTLGLDMRSIQEGLTKIVVLQHNHLMSQMAEEDETNRRLLCEDLVLGARTYYIATILTPLVIGANLSDETLEAITCEFADELGELTTKYVKRTAEMTKTNLTLDALKAKKFLGDN